MNINRIVYCNTKSPSLADCIMLYTTVLSKYSRALKKLKTSLTKGERI